MNLRDQSKKTASGLLTVTSLCVRLRNDVSSTRIINHILNNK